MFIEKVPNRFSPPCILLRETFRDAGKVRHRTLANLTKWPDDLLEGLRSLLELRRGSRWTNSNQSNFGSGALVYPAVAKLLRDFLTPAMRFNTMRSGFYIRTSHD